MAKINDTTTYPNTTPALSDHVPGTDVSDTGNDANGETVTFTLSSILALEQSAANITGGTIDGATIGGTTPAAISGTTGTFSGDLAVNTDDLFVDVSAGNVGIGTTSPAYPLDVLGDIRISNNEYLRCASVGGSNAVRMLGINSGDTAYLGPIDTGPTTTIVNASSTANTLALYTAGSESARIDSSGNVGIGTTAPDTTLDVNGAITQRPLSSDPADPDSGNSVMWVSDGTGSGDAGDVMLKINVGGTTKTITLVDYSAS